MTSKKTATQTFGLILALAAIVAAAPFLWTIGVQQPDPTAGIGPGEPMPVAQRRPADSGRPSG